MHPILTCKNCGNHFHGKFCNQCGEKVYARKDKSIWHIVEEFFHFTSHFEGSFLTTLKAIVAKPGQLSLDYCNGIRKKYFKPISFFLLIVVIYLFVFPRSTGLNLNISNHIHQWYGEYALRAAKKVMIEKSWTEAMLVENYNHLSEKVSKFLLFLLIPVMAIFCAVFAWKKKQPFFDHLIYATEIIADFILWGFLIIPLVIHILNRIFLHSLDGPTDLFALPVILLLTGLYIYFSAKRFYRFATGRAILFTLLFLVVLSVFVHYVYSAVLFFIIILLIH